MLRCLTLLCHCSSEQADRTKSCIRSSLQVFSCDRFTQHACAWHLLHMLHRSIRCPASQHSLHSIVAFAAQHGSIRCTALPQSLHSIAAFAIQHPSSRCIASQPSLHIRCMPAHHPVHFIAAFRAWHRSIQCMASQHSVHSTASFAPQHRSIPGMGPCVHATFVIMITL